MAETPQFAPGDVVVHTVRPEWGEGIVGRAQLIQHEGKNAQRLEVKFTHKGRITLNTAMAPLMLKSERDAARARSSRAEQEKSGKHDMNNGNGKDPHNSHTPTGPNNPSSPSSKDAGKPMRNDTNTLQASKNHGGGWLAELEAKAAGNGTGNGEELRQLPDALSDPFLTLEQRVEAALDTYRFTTEARSLIEWAIGQTGLDDPMSRYTRHELEQGFDWFCRDRDLQLKELVREAKSRGRQDMLDGLRKRIQLPAAVSALDKARNSV